MHDQAATRPTSSIRQAANQDVQHICHAMQLASFLSELESSGLLDKSSPQPVAQDASQPASASSPSNPGFEPASSPEPGPHTTAPEPNLAAAIVSAVTEDASAVPQQQDAPDLPNQEAEGGVDAGADAVAGEPAEQRVLGALEGAPTWREVAFLSHSCMYCMPTARTCPTQSRKTVGTGHSHIGAILKNMMILY